MTTAEQTTLFLAARSLVAQQLGLPGFNTMDLSAQRSAYGALSPADQVRLADALAVYVKSNPAGFSPEQTAEASTRVSDPAFGTGMADTSLGASVDEFFAAFGENAKSIFGGMNSTLKIVLALAAVVLAGWLVWRFAGPRPGRK